MDLFWTPIDADCVQKYTITLTNITEGNASYVYNTTTNTTNITLSDLMQRAEYTFTVAGVDAEGRVGERSPPSEHFTFDGKKSHNLSDFRAQNDFTPNLKRLLHVWKICGIFPVSILCTKNITCTESIYIYM